MYEHDRDSTAHDTYEPADAQAPVPAALRHPPGVFAADADPDAARLARDPRRMGHVERASFEVVRRLQDEGYRAVFVGGSVRDRLMGLSPKDFDVATDAHPDVVQSLFRRTLAVGARFGVIIVLNRGQGVQTATFRADGSYTDGRRPDSVAYGSLETDAFRRDITINGMAYDPVNRVLYDLVGGRADVEGRLIRMIGDAHARLHEDHLRVLRVVRFAVRFGFDMEPATLAAVQSFEGVEFQLPAERVGDELGKILDQPGRRRFVERMVECRMFDRFFEPLIPHRDAAHGLLSHLSGDASCSVAWACLYDPLARAEGIDATIERIRALKQPKARLFAIRELWSRRERFDRYAALSPKEQRRLTGVAGALDHLAYLWARVRAHAAPRAAVEAFSHRMHGDASLRAPEPVVTGDDAIRAGLTPGPAVGRALEAVAEAQLTNEVTTREDALALLARIAAEARAG